MDAVGGHLGELLHASAQSAEREQLVWRSCSRSGGATSSCYLATQVLSEVFDYRDMVKRLAQVAVPVLADLCLIDIAGRGRADRPHGRVARRPGEARR